MCDGDELCEEDWFRMNRFSTPDIDPSSPTFSSSNCCITALFDARSGEWERMPNIPLGTAHQAGICRIGRRIYVIGGYYWTFGTMVYRNAVRCFDLDERKWVRYECGKFPGSADRGYAIAPVGEDTIVVAGGFSGGGGRGGWLGGGFQRGGSSCSYVYSLNLRSGTWIRLPDLPAEITCLGKPCSGFTITSDLERTAGRMGDGTHQVSFVFVCGNLWARLPLPAGDSSQWEICPDLRGVDGVPALIQCRAKELSWEEFQALSDAIHSLPERLEPGFMQIIREAEIFNENQDEIDIDLDRLDARTLRKLQRYVIDRKSVV